VGGRTAAGAAPRAVGGVYVSRHWFGSPSTRYGLEATRRIVEIDGEPVADLDGFLARVAEKRDGDAVRLETVDLDGKPSVITLKLDLQYWPTYELRHTEKGWERIVPGSAPAQAEPTMSDAGAASLEGERDR